MAIVQSVIKVYKDKLMTNLITTQTTSGDSTDITISSLSVGSEYWATVTVTDSIGGTSDESAPFRFYTLCDVEFVSGPTAGVNYITAQLRGLTNDVTVARCGLIYSTDSSFTDAVSVDESRGGVLISNLLENTTYYLMPFVVDTMGRRWVNQSLVTTATTGLSIPEITWSGISAVGSTVFDSSVKIASSSALTSVYATITPVGGTSQTVSLANTVGVQSVHIDNLKPSTEYTIYVTAVNSAGTATTETITFTTNESAVNVTIENATVDNATNIINVDSKAEYDSSIITITGHWVDLYENDEHRGAAFESVSGGAFSTVSVNLSHADPDETYFVFGRVTYTVAGDATVYTAWSEQWEVLTYSLFSFGNSGTDGTIAKFDFSVDGDAQSTVIEYSTDQINWTKVAVGDPNGETILLNGLDPETTYYFKGRTKSAAGWSGYDTMTLTTGEDTAHQIVITSVTNITSDSAIINVTIS